MADYYLWIKWLHIIAVISWMAGLLYLPRLFVYHVETNSPEAKTEYEAAEIKLLKRIMNPAMIVTWLSGIGLIMAAVDVSTEKWILVKLLLVLAMTAFHGICGKWRKQLAAGICEKSGKQFRLLNEVPTVLMIVIVGLVVFKPF